MNLGVITFTQSEAERINQIGIPNLKAFGVDSGLTGHRFKLILCPTIEFHNTIQQSRFERWIEEQVKLKVLPGGQLIYI